jgi:DNA mismatch repair protein MutS
MSKNKKGTETPLMEQYNQMKTLHSDAILLFRVGDFYETFAQDAVHTAKTLGITLTARNNGGSNIELAGFPYHSLDTYLPRLIKAGYRVAICEQLEKPSPHKKIVKRGVTEILTPGVVFSDNALDHKSNNYLCALHIDSKDNIGMSLLDVSTGEFLLSEGDLPYIEKLLQSFTPAEILVAKSKFKDWSKRWEDSFYLYALEDWIYTADYTQEKLLNQFEVLSLKGFGIEEMAAGQIAAGVILHYVATTEHNNLKHINQIARLQADKYVWLDKFTVRNLELVQSLHPAGQSLLNVIDNTISPMGCRLLRKWILLPLKDIKNITARQDMVSFFLANEMITEKISNLIRQIGDLERLIGKVPVLKVNPRDLKQLQKALFAISEIKIILANSQSAPLLSFAERLQTCTSIHDRLQKEIVDNPPVKLDIGDYMQNGINPELDELRDLVKNTNGYISNLEQKAMLESGIPTLKIGRTDAFGYYLEVTNKYKGSEQIPTSWYRKQTLTNAERYTTEELKQLEERILSAEDKTIELEKKMFYELLSDLQEYIRPIQTNANLIAQLDCYLSFAQVAHLHNYCRPVLHEGLDIDIKAGRHPVIEKQLKNGDLYVPNDVFLDQEQQQIIVITGPNMAGKSALLRQTALISLLAQMGSFVPAQSAKLGIVDKIFTRVGASDNISAGESTFMVEMNETASILNNISQRSLILLDEIGRGTSTYDGISIAWAVAEYLHNSLLRPKTLFATHYHELNQLTEQMDRIKNYHVATKEMQGKVIFLRKLVTGGSEHSFGIHVAKLAGMPKELLNRAQEILIQLEEKDKDMGANPLTQKLQNLPTTRTQLAIFEPIKDQRWAKIESLLNTLELNSMTPIDCMIKLVELKKYMDLL